MAIKAPVFVVGTGRCGTQLMADLFKMNQQVDSFHIRNSEVDSFYRFVAWNELPIDQSPLINSRRRWVQESYQREKIYFESNPYLSFHIEELYSQLDAKFVFLVRNPEAVIRSHVSKGWYNSAPERVNSTLTLGLQYDWKVNHAFGRFVPKGAFYNLWKRYSQIGKLSWMWNMVNKRIYSQLENIPVSNQFFLGIEDLDFDVFQKLENFVGVNSGISPINFRSTMNRKPNKRKKNTDTWTADEKAEFEKLTHEFSEILNKANFG